jgi:predicted chitinase
MINRKHFFDHTRTYLFGGTLKQSQVNGLTGILDEWEKNWPDKDDRWLAYMLATAHHETNMTMQPVKEAYWVPNQDAFMKKTHPEYYPYYGRGYVQLTWKANYEKAGKKLGIDLVNNPGLAMAVNNASEIMFTGMTEGWFTGKKLADYFKSATEDWINARRIINGLDKANLVAEYGKRYYAAISHTV